MCRVFIPPQLRDVTAGQSELSADGHTLGSVIAALDARFPGLAARLAQGGRLMPGLAVSIDGAVTSRGLLARVEPDSEIHIIPAIGGG